MTKLDLIAGLLSVITGLVINEISDVSPWLARWLVRKAAYLPDGDTPRARIRAEEYQALINDRPGKLLKLCTALGFLITAAVMWARRSLAGHLRLSEFTSATYPSSLVSRYFFPTEQYRGEWVRHWIVPARSIVVGVLAGCAATYAAGRFLHGLVFGLTLSGIIVATLSWVVWRLLDWRLTRFVITNKRMFVIQGIFARRLAMAPLMRVTDLKSIQSPVGRMLGYGKIAVESDLSHMLRSITYLPKPNDLYERVVGEMYELKG